MRASLRALAVAALALTTASFAAAAKGGKASEDRKVSDFTGVEVQAGIRAIISIADRRVTVEGDEDSVARVRTAAEQLLAIAPVSVRGGEVVTRESQLSAQCVITGDPQDTGSVCGGLRDRLAQTP
jgi:hypothetical protein